jgi:hypothetical protein
MEDEFDTDEYAEYYPGPYGRGRRAGENGEPYLDCPYEDDMHERRAWQVGHQRARMELSMLNDMQGE